MKKNISGNEVVYWLQDGTYIVESKDLWAVGDEAYDGLAITAIEEYDYNKDYDIK